jgi:hypothetical protein
MDIFRFRKYTLNNGILSGEKAMPMKDLTSDGTADFSLSRLAYTNALVVPTVSETLQKKWIGGCRDASQIITNRRLNTTGQILSNQGPTSFKNISDNNTARQALNRCRSQGACVPRKSTHNTTIF